MKTPTAELDPEIVAISAVHAALKGLESDVQARVLNYVAVMLKLSPPTSGTDKVLQPLESEQSADFSAIKRMEGAPETDDELEGISPVAKKWMARNGLQAKQLSVLFSLGVDEIDLIAQTVPGRGKKDKMRSVFLLKGVAAYLGSGVAHFTHQQVKETCLHYDAFDAANFATNFRSLSSEVSGDKDNGYTLTARGLASATDMVRTMTQSR